ncbi:hypothetical protein [Amycolatopsis minnesotensis]|uniref:Phage-related protein n=1 Tax=Amycolatopsis minnesotensis TaxID=337894 RepID=A0ABP5BDX6_9PSEU
MAAKGPGGKEVARVSVRVVPDSSKFPKDLEKDLKEQSGHEIEVPVDLDTKAAEAHFKAFKEALQRQKIEAKVSLDAGPISRVAASMDRARRPLAGIGALMEGWARSLRSVGQSAERTANAIVRARREAAAAAAETLRWVGWMIKFTLTTDNARKAWASLTGSVKKLASEIRQVPMLLALVSRYLALSATAAGRLAKTRITGFVSALFSGRTYAEAFYRSMERVAVFGARTADAFDRLRRIKLSDVGRALRGIGTAAAGAVRGVSRLGKSFVSSLGKGIGKTFDATVKGIGSAIKSGFSGAANILSSVASGFGKISTSMLLVGAIVSIIAPLVGLVSTLLAGIPSLALAAGAAFAAIYLGLDGIKRAASGLKPLVDKLKASLSDTFDKALTPIFKRLATVFPTLEAGLTSVAKGLVPLAAGFTNVVTSASGMKQIRTILDNTGKFFASLQPMVENFMRAFLTLGEVGSQSFGVLAGVLNTFAANFNAMVQRLKNSGQLTAALEALGKVTGALLDMFTRLFEAGVQAMGQMGGPLSTLITALTNAFVAMTPILTTISNLLSNVLGAALNAMVPVLTALTPAFQLLGNIVGTLLVGAIQAAMPILTTIAKIIGEMVLLALKAIEPILPPLIAFLTQLGQIVGTALLQAFTAVSPLLTLAAQFLTQILQALMPILPAIAELVSAGLQVFIDILSALMPPLIQLAQAIFPVLVDVVKQCVPVFLDIVKALTDLMPIITDIVLAVGQALMPIFQSLWNLVKEIWPSIKDIIEGALTAIKGIIDFVMGIITGDWDRAWKGIQTLLDGVWQMIKGALEAGLKAIVWLFTDLPMNLLRALGNLGGLLLGVGKDLLVGLWNGIAGAADWLWQKVKEFFSWLLPNWVKDMLGINSPSKVFADIGKWIPPGLANGIDANARVAADAAKTLASGVVDAFSINGDARQYGKAVAADWAAGLNSSQPVALAAVDDMAALVNDGVSAQWRGQVSADGFGSIGDKVADALSGWNVQIDKFGLASLVRNANSRNENGR